MHQPKRLRQVPRAAEWSRDRGPSVKRIFLSYSYGDLDTARELAENLRHADISLDPDFAISGQQIVEQLNDTLRSASAVIILVSERSLKSQWVQFELGVALGTGKPIIPVLIGNEELHLPEWLQGLPYLDARNRPLSDVAKELTQALSARGVV
jgi:TIR domain-containing protein